jgi:hypothetical protein
MHTEHNAQMRRLGLPASLTNEESEQEPEPDGHNQLRRRSRWSGEWITYGDGLGCRSRNRLRLSSIC